jgi:hypothetical protein
MWDPHLLSQEEAARLRAVAELILGARPRCAPRALGRHEGRGVLPDNAKRRNTDVISGTGYRAG